MAELFGTDSVISLRRPLIVQTHSKSASLSCETSFQKNRFG